jgi:IS605 OrfB family transposase
MSIITLKIKYTSDNRDRLIELIKNYNSIFGLVYNYVFSDNKASTKSIIDYLKSKNNLILDTYFRNSAIYDAKAEIAKDNKNKIIFGGKKLFLDRLKGLVSKDDYSIKKLRPLNMVGAAHNNGNCKFQIISENEILFKPSRNEHFTLSLINVGKNYQRYLKSLVIAQKECRTPISYKLCVDYIYISFELDSISDYSVTQKVKDRIFAIDLNPNYIGWSVVDWKNSDSYKVIKSGLYSIKELNDFDDSLCVSSDSKERKYVTNKRHYECNQIAHSLAKLANHFKCEIFSIEDLTISSPDKCKGRKFNKLCNNQWCRNKLVNVINKLCDCYGIRLIKVQANYSSFEGNLVYRNKKLPDMCLSSIEIGRRGYEFYHQYILKDTCKKKNIIFNTSLIALTAIKQSLEELNCSCAFKDLQELYSLLKKTRCNYRVPINEVLKYRVSSLFSKVHIRSFVCKYEF